MTDTLPLSGKLALVTGASRGIGAATAKALAAAGAHVVLTARTTGGLEEVEDAIHKAGGHATIAPLDLIDGESIGRLAQAIAGRWDALDILVLNAATLGSLAAVPAIDAKEFARLLTLNIAAPQALIAAFDRMLRASKDARVVALTSSVATPRAYWGAYGASKAALETLVGAYGEEMKNISAIRTHIVDPAATRTAMRARAFPGEDPATVKEPEVAADAIVDLVVADTPTGHRVRIER
ncbi:MAG: SDR family NAD(P)-dependent oxidoreductase [Sphingobium sp.]|jgi:NAD(P)-dependent dehydrogenase (short-subunit alcohol dehydrogenase family)|uniref:SDR family NAD(P)-dependent oxidoreductase n=1 Tax=Sphingobium sp. TaxID=1912891 RepID=UPI000C60E04A|nr:SDR family NAD(P)-dependent oxidoreductase [Sphingobium sp.]MBU0659471.1 SDR family NAD(P)-dependent oxidoreductase [Alphaproteobacteria bacterium]MBA4755800.1 SDR family NAD(P)-dependent oxidoreductase [Sphingobium sp.]MBS90747.1 oxidoreductase [Sphingobium sp.]MBU0775534.1 SDR family NAD(P)-dependent oxidoreductase [Alphaproteobacteria bacterium]MBU1464357.1 SDR family NAD(P)-dependent oxidoreductase [Alphaproteobacteria bacterium]